MVFSAATWAFDWVPPYDKAIEAISALEFGGVELRITDPAQLNTAYNEKNTATLKALIEQKGLEVTNLVYMPKGASSTCEKERATAVSDFSSAAKVAKTLGAKLFTVSPSYAFEIPMTDEHYKPSMQIWSMDMGGHQDFATNFACYLDTLREFSAICKTNGLKMAIETVPNTWVKNTDAALHLLEKLGDLEVGICYDVANISMVGELAELFVYRLNRRIFHIQMADNHGVSNAHWRPGKGKNDFEAVIAALKDVGYQGTFGFELADAKGAAGNPAIFYNPTADYAVISKEHNLAMREIKHILAEAQ